MSTNASYSIYLKDILDEELKREELKRLAAAPKDNKYSQEDLRRARVDFPFFCSKFARVIEPRPNIAEEDEDLDFETYLKDKMRGGALADEALEVLENEMVEVSGTERPFELFDYQIKCSHWFNWLSKKGQSGAIEKCRDMGMSWLVVWYFVWCWLFKQRYSALLGSRKEAAVDNLKLSSLFGKLDYAIECLKDTPLYPESYKRKIHRSKLSIVNPSNGNFFVGDSQTPDIGRGDRHTHVFLDEYTVWDFDVWDSMLMVSRTVIVGGSANGENHFYHLVQRLKKISPHLAFRMEWWQNPYHKELDPGWYERMQARMDEAKFAQEVLIDYKASVKGKYYSVASMVAHHDRLDWTPGWPSVVCLDYGVKDNTALIWIQRDPETERHRLMYCYTNNGQPIDFYIPILLGRLPTQEELEQWQYQKSDIEFIQWLIDEGVTADLEYRGDPAGRQRSQQSATSIEFSLNEAGIYVASDTKQNSHEMRKAAGTSVLIKSDLNEQDKTWRGAYAAFHAIEMAKYPHRQENSQATMAPRNPVHDWTSHYRSAFEYYAVGEAPPQEGEKQRAGSFMIFGAQMK